VAQIHAVGLIQLILPSGCAVGADELRQVATALHNCVLIEMELLEVLVVDCILRVTGCNARLDARY